MLRMEMKELEASCNRFAERRYFVTPPRFDRRDGAVGKHRAGQARMAYIMQVPYLGISDSNAQRMLRSPGGRRA
jgi:hypothetical protein